MEKEIVNLRAADICYIPIWYDVRWNCSERNSGVIRRGINAEAYNAVDLKMWQRMTELRRTGKLVYPDYPIAKDF